MRTRLTMFAAVAAVGTIAADLAGSPAVFLLKPLALTLLFAATLAAAPSPSPRYRGLIAAGLLCSLAGDVLLLWPERLFTAGLVAFLVAHVCYLTAFRTDGGDRPPVRLVVPLLAGAVAILAVIWEGLGAMRVPVVGYIGVIVTMWWAALGRWRVAGSRSGLLAAAGATAFVASDGLLAINRFWAPLPVAAALVLIPYYAAQLLLAASVGTTAGAGALGDAT